METNMDTLWILLAAVLVFFMQAGFAMLEAGLTRAKNAANIIMKGLSDMCIGAISFFLVGWGLMYGKSFLGIIGTSQFALSGVDDLGYRDWFFQAVFAATAATIISGAMSERAKFSGYLIISCVVTALIYPISGGWIWNSGWIAQLGFYDFAGSSVVHLVGGVCAFWAAVFLGPRTGKYLKRSDGSIRVRPYVGHSIPLAGLGTFILWFGWYGFNGGSTLSATDPNIPLVMLNTTLGAASGTLGAIITAVILYKKPDTPITLNGTLGGLVSITAGAYIFSPAASIIAGVIGGILVAISCILIEHTLKVDDPVGASSVHGVCGIWGTVAVALFGNLDGIGSNLSRLEQLGVQLTGVLAVILWCSICSAILFFVLKKIHVLRSDKQEELIGLDISEHGNEAYGNFQIFNNS